MLHVCIVFARGLEEKSQKARVICTCTQLRRVHRKFSFIINETSPRDFAKRRAFFQVEAEALPLTHTYIDTAGPVSALQLEEQKELQKIQLEAITTE